jgi:hypothetical protein
MLATLKEIFSDVFAYVFNPDARKPSPFKYPSGNAMSVRAAKQQGLLLQPSPQTATAMMIANTPQQFDDMQKLLSLACAFKEPGQRAAVLQDTMRECNHDVYVVEVHRVELQCDGEHDVKLYIMFMFDADQGNTFDGRLVVKCQDGKLVSQLQMAV